MVRYRVVLLLLLIMAASSASSQQCAQKSTPSGGSFCTKKNAGCSPVTYGSGASGRCRTIGDSCECVGQLSFSISLSPNSVDLAQGASVSAVVNVEPDDGFEGNISLTMANLPGGMTATFAPPSVPGNSKSTSILTISSDQNINLGLYSAEVKGVSGSTSADAALAIEVKAAIPQKCAQIITPSGGSVCTKRNAGCAPVTYGSGTSGHCRTIGDSCECVGQLSFNITVSPPSVDLVQGASVSVVVNIDPDAGFQGNISLTIDNLPAGMAAAFAPPSVSGSASSTSTLTLSSDQNIKTGVYLLEVKGVSGATSAVAALSVEIKLPPNAQLWGFADLHTHPATFLAFGSDDNGNNGLFWGHPGMNLADSSSDAAIAADLPSCDEATHSPHNDPDVVRKAERSGIISNLDQSVPQWPHGIPGKVFALGQPTFDSWPAALSLEHQQMHITEIRRAYDGGLRLLFASTTDNEVLTDLWRTGFNSFGNDIPTPTGTFDYDSARKQLMFIQSFVAANSSWMQIVTNATDARQVIRQNKLAVVLSLEMDSLYTDQILDLASQFGVRHVIPVHLSNNTIGGTAVYDDLWNNNTFFQTAQFIRVRTNHCVSFRLGLPQHLGYNLAGGISPEPIDAATFASLGYLTDINLGGHENDMGINENELQRMMSAGLLLDIVHMAEKSADGALAIAELYGYPVMDSHTGLRDDSDCSKPAPAGVNERSIPFSQASRIATLGGVLGLGTATNNTADAVATWVSKYLEALNVMGGKRVALGTDTNGLSPLIYNNFYNLPTTYPLTVQTLFDAPADVPQQMQPFKLLSKTYNFASDGLAHYGMLPDFFQAVHDHPDTSYSPCAGQCQSCSAACRIATEGDTNACLQSCLTQFPNPSPPVPNPNANTALQAIYHSAKDVLDMWDMTETASGKVPVPQGVQCSVFDLDKKKVPINVAGPSDAIFVLPIEDKKHNVTGRQVCIPNKINGTCRQFFGLCSTTGNQSSVRFSIFGDGDQNRLGPLNQIYFDRIGRACVSGEPDIAPDATCRKWFGDAVTADGQDVSCSVFDDGYTTPIGKSSAVLNTETFDRSRSSFDSCVPSGPNGVCKKWFGRCVAWPTISAGQSKAMQPPAALIVH